ncbi:MAG: hypothetical protein ABIA04_04815 [Pseudomonadota bacterium]
MKELASSYEEALNLNPNQTGLCVNHYLGFAEIEARQTKKRYWSQERYFRPDTQNKYGTLNTSYNENLVNYYLNLVFDTRNKSLNFSHEALVKFIYADRFTFDKLVINTTSDIHEEQVWKVIDNQKYESFYPGKQCYKGYCLSKSDKDLAKGLLSYFHNEPRFRSSLANTDIIFRSDENTILFTPINNALTIQSFIWSGNIYAFLDDFVYWSMRHGQQQWDQLVECMDELAFKNEDNPASADEASRHISQNTNQNGDSFTLKWKMEVLEEVSLLLKEIDTNISL